MTDKTFHIMAGDLYIKVESKKDDTKIVDFCFDKVKELVNKLNFFDKNSLLTKLNENKKIEYDQDIAYLLEESLKLYKKSSGKFNIFLGEDIKRRKLNLDSKRVKIDDVDKLIKIDKNSIEILNKDITIDLGGIAKGYIVDRVFEKTKNEIDRTDIDMLIDARGDIRVESKKNVEIEVENPFNNLITFQIIKLDKGSIITSGHNKQKFKEGSHIIGKNNDIYTITLISKKEKTYLLDALGTWLAQERSEKVLEMLEFDEYFKDIEGLMILNNGKILKSSFWNIYSKN